MKVTSVGFEALVQTAPLATTVSAGVVLGAGSQVDAAVRALAAAPAARQPPPRLPQKRRQPQKVLPRPTAGTQGSAATAFGGDGI